MKRIVCAANKFPDGSIILGVRHWDRFMCNQANALGIKGGTEEQGFIDQFGTFYNRVEALELVKENGQHFDSQRNSHHDSIDDCDELYSEGLY